MEGRCSTPNVGVAVAGADVLEVAWTRLVAVSIRPGGTVRTLSRACCTERRMSRRSGSCTGVRSRLAERYPALDASRLD